MGKRIVDGENVGIALCCFDKRSYHINTDAIHGRDSLRMYIVCALQWRMFFGDPTFMARSDPITKVLRHGLQTKRFLIAPYVLCLPPCPIGDLSPWNRRST